MLAQKTVTVGKTQYTISEWSTDEALFWCATLAQAGSGALLGVSAFPKDGDLLSQEINFGAAVRGVLLSLPPKQFVHLCRQLLIDSLAEPQFDDDWFNSTFSGNLDELFELHGKIVQFNLAHLVPTLKKTAVAVFGLSFSTPPGPTPADSESTP